MPHMKLIKLLYIAERTSIQKNGYPILGDDIFSMRYGPVLSVTLNYMKGKFPPDNGWDKWVSSIQEHKVSLARQYCTEDLNLLSDATLKILAEVWEEFSNIDEWEISDYTHQNFPEWQDPGDSSEKITYKKLLDALGYGEKSAKIAEELEAQQQVRKALLK